MMVVMSKVQAGRKFCTYPKVRENKKDYISKTGCACGLALAVTSCIALEPISSFPTTTNVKAVPVQTRSSWYASSWSLDKLFLYSFFSGESAVGKSR